MSLFRPFPTVTSVQAALRRAVAAQPWYNSLFCVLFCAALFVPALFLNRGAISLKENRPLAVFPKLKTEGGEINYGFGRDFETWFQDRFGGRDILVRLYFRSVARLSGMLYENSLARMYPNHWTFYKPQENLRHPYPEQQQAIIAALSSLQGYCKGHGITPYVVICPNKEDIYAELNPKATEADVGGACTAFVQSVRTALPQLRLFYPQEEMLAAIRREPQTLLHYKTDTHTSEDGGHVITEALLQEIRKDFPDVPAVAEKSQFAVTPVKGRYYGEWENGKEKGVAPGVLVGMLQADAAEAEDTLYPHYTEDALHAEMTYGPARLQEHSRCPRGVRRAVIIGDSSSQYVTRWLRYSFAELLRFRYNNGEEDNSLTFKRWEQQIQDFRPDILIICLSGGPSFAPISSLF